MKRSFFVIIGLVIISLVLGCNSQKETKEINNILSPNEIFIFQNGVKTELPKGSPFFNKIVELTNQRVDDSLTVVKDIVDEDVVNTLKKDNLGMEFIYNKEQSLKKGFVTVNFNKLYFPLVSSNYGEGQGSKIYTMQYGVFNYTDSSRGPLTEPNEIINILKDYKLSENLQNLINKSSGQSLNKANKFISMNDIFVKKIIPTIGLDGVLISLELKTFAKYQKDVNDSGKFYEIADNTMVWVAKIRYPNGIDTKAGFFENATCTSVYNAITGRFICGNTSSHPFKNSLKTRDLNIEKPLKYNPEISITFQEPYSELEKKLIYARLFRYDDGERENLEVANNYDKGEVVKLVRELDKALSTKPNLVKVANEDTLYNLVISKEITGVMYRIHADFVNSKYYLEVDEDKLYKTAQGQLMLREIPIPFSAIRLMGVVN